MDEYDPMHPHERDRGLPPILDEEGRCLRCSWEYHTEYIASLVAQLEAAQAENTRLAAKVERMQEWIDRADQREPLIEAERDRLARQVIDLTKGIARFINWTETRSEEGWVSFFANLLDATPSEDQ